jgi:hypothetical protein
VAYETSGKRERSALYPVVLLWRAAFNGDEATYVIKAVFGVRDSIVYPRAHIQVAWKP